MSTGNTWRRGHLIHAWSKFARILIAGWKVVSGGQWHRALLRSSRYPRRHRLRALCCVVKLTLYNLLSLISGLPSSSSPRLYLRQSARRVLEQKCKIRSKKKYACEPRTKTLVHTCTQWKRQQALSGLCSLLQRRCSGKLLAHFDANYVAACTAKHTIETIHTRNLVYRGPETFFGVRFLSAQWHTLHLAMPNDIIDVNSISVCCWLLK